MAVCVRNTFIDLDCDLDCDQPTAARGRSNSLPRDFFKMAEAKSVPSLKGGCSSPHGSSNSRTLWSDDVSTDDASVGDAEISTASSDFGTPPVPEFTFRAPRAKLRVGARAFAPGGAQGIGEREVQALKNALLRSPGVSLAEVSVKRGLLAPTPTTSVAVELRAGADAVAILALAQATLMAAFGQSVACLLLGFDWQPFTELADGSGFSATFAKVPAEERCNLCWNSLQCGRCLEEAYCPWRHPRASELMLFELRVSRATAFRADGPSCLATEWPSSLDSRQRWADVEERSVEALPEEAAQEVCDAEARYCPEAPVLDMPCPVAARGPVLLGKERWDLTGSLPWFEPLLGQAPVKPEPSAVKATPATVALSQHEPVDERESSKARTSEVPIPSAPAAGGAALERERSVRFAKAELKPIPNYKFAGALTSRGWLFTK